MIIMAYLNIKIKSNKDIFTCSQYKLTPLSIFSGDLLIAPEMSAGLVLLMSTLAL